MSALKARETDLPKRSAGPCYFIRSTSLASDSDLKPQRDVSLVLTTAKVSPEKGRVRRPLYYETDVSIGSHLFVWLSAILFACYPAASHGDPMCSGDFVNLGYRRFVVGGEWGQILAFLSYLSKGETLARPPLKFPSLSLPALANRVHSYFEY